MYQVAMQQRYLQNTNTKMTNNLMINKFDIETLSEHIDTLKKNPVYTDVDEVVLRSSLSGQVGFDMRSLQMFMIFPAKQSRKNVIPYTSSGQVLEALRTSTADDIIEFPMGHNIREEIYMSTEKGDNERVFNIKDFTKEKISERVWHAMTINHLYKFLATVGAKPVDTSSSWKGEEYNINDPEVSDRYIVRSNMTFTSSYEYLVMKRTDVIDYLENIMSGFPCTPKVIKRSYVYYSKYTVLHNRSLYIPIRGERRTQSNSPGRFLYIYDCISSWLRKAENTYFLIERNIINNSSGKFEYCVRDFADFEPREYHVVDLDEVVRNKKKVVSSDEMSRMINPCEAYPIKFGELETFRDFANVDALSLEEKLIAVSNLFELLGIRIDLSLVRGESELRDYFVNRSAEWDPLSNYVDMYSNGNKKKLLIEEMYSSVRHSTRVYTRPTEGGEYNVPNIGNPQVAAPRPRTSKAMNYVHVTDTAREEPPAYSGTSYRDGIHFGSKPKRTLPTYNSSGLRNKQHT